jgi:hypothetical protein
MTITAPSITHTQHLFYGVELHGCAFTMCSNYCPQHLLHILHYMLIPLLWLSWLNRLHRLTNRSPWQTSTSSTSTSAFLSQLCQTSQSPDILSAGATHTVDRSPHCTHPTHWSHKFWDQITVSLNIKAVNDAYNSILIEEAESIDSFDNFDNLHLAKKLEKHELLEFRRFVATFTLHCTHPHMYVIQINGPWEESIPMSKQGMPWWSLRSRDGLKFLVNYVVDIGNKEPFAAMLYLCFDLLGLHQ